MEAFALYLLKSVIWLAGFTLVFILFLRNERFFQLNRIYLIAGILTSFCFPLISIHYTVVLPVVRNLQSENAVVSEIRNTGSSIIPDLRLMLLILYASGVLLMLTLIIRQGISVFKAIKKAEIINLKPLKLIKSSDYTSAFSFFSYVFVNPSITDVETKEIMNHEIVHIRQKHWLDLVLVELLCMMQWFNPLVWIYVRFIRQNHEYLADEVALQRTSDPAIYRAALLNQIVGASVVSLSNSFNYSLNKKRFNMMKNIISSPYRKMKILLILPVFAIVLYAFAKPDYKYKFADQSSGDKLESVSFLQNEVKGTILEQNGKPLPGAIVTLQGTTIGTIADASGSFRIVDVPDDGVLVVSFVGFKSKVIKPDFKAPMIIAMMKDTVKYTDINISTPPPPPPPPPTITSLFSGDGPKPLFVVDGKITSAADVEKIDPNSIESISILKKDSDKYGSKGKDGVVEITLKKEIKGSPNQLPVVPPPPPPPPFQSEKIRQDGPPPLYVVDGIIMTAEEVDIITPDKIESVNVLKLTSDKYGEKGKNGVVEITTKEKSAKMLVIIDGVVYEKDGKSKIDNNEIKSMNILDEKHAIEKYGEKGKYGAMEVTNFQKGEKRPEVNKDPFVVVEELPQFPGGKEALITWITANIKYPGEAVKNKITGKVLVNFNVTSTGKVKNVVVTEPVNPQLDAEAIRLIGSMPDWKPGSQSGKSVDVQVCVPVEFKLN